VESIATKANHYRASSSLDDNSAYGEVENSRARESELATFAGRIHDPTGFGDALLGSRIVNRMDRTAPTVTCAHFFLDAPKRELWYQRGPARGDGMCVARI
jgi:hypothetical protein